MELRREDRPEQQPLSPINSCLDKEGLDILRRIARCTSLRQLFCACTGSAFRIQYTWHGMAKPFLSTAVYSIRCMSRCL